MGINGLLPVLKSIQKPTHIKHWKGQTVAVDAYGWLHRGTISCAIELALGRHTTKYVDYAMQRVRMLQHYGVIPYIVFDGDYLPGKKGTEIDREKKRKSSRNAGLELLRLGRTSAAHLELQKAIDVTPLMARYLIEELKKAGVSYVVAPYEADAQMAYLERIGEVSAIISEDSDLLVFGAKCLLTKLDQYGSCIAIDRSEFSKAVDINISGWSDSEFRRMAILSGCDYLTNIPKMGIKTAYKFVHKYRSVEKIIRAIRMDGSFSVPVGYEQAFITAEMTFQYQQVYCPISEQLVTCTGDKVPDSVGLQQAENFGSSYESCIASRVACGDLDPITKLEITLSGEFKPAPTQCRPNSTITRYFGTAPRAVLSELQQTSHIPQYKTPISNHRKPCVIPSPNSANTNSKPKPPPGQIIKKSKLCMDDDATIAACTERSPFFSKRLNIAPQRQVQAKPPPGTPHIVRAANSCPVDTETSDEISQKTLSSNPDAKNAKNAGILSTKKILTSGQIGCVSKVTMKNQCGLTALSLDMFRFQTSAPLVGTKRPYPFGRIDDKENI